VRRVLQPEVAAATAPGLVFPMDDIACSSVAIMARQVDRARVMTLDKPLLS